MEHLAATTIRNRIACGVIKSIDIVRQAFAQIEKSDSEVQAYLTLFKDQALQQAEAIDQKIASRRPVGALAGVPVAVSDNICTAFGPTTCGSKMLQNFHAPYNAHVIEKLLEADAVLVGKTNLDEFAMGSSTEYSGFQQTRNPWNLSYVPGGSSGGSAAAVAARMCCAALGSDTDGSIRQPAAFCGVVGLKPAYGRVSRYGLAAYGSSMEQIGPITQTVEDAALLMNIIAGHDPRDSACVSEQIAGVCDYTAQLQQPIEGLRIAVAPRLLEGIQPDVKKAIEEALKVYQTLGAQLVEIAMPHFDYALSAGSVIAVAEASSNLACYDGIRYGYRSPAAQDYAQIYSKSREEALGTEVKRRILLARVLLDGDHYDLYYLKALKVRTLICGDFTRAFEQADCLMLPVSPTTAFRLGEKTADPLQMYLADVYTIAANLAGLPAISIPCGFDRQGLPIGLQILSASFTEDKLLRIARMYESQTEWHRQRPKLVAN